MQSVEVGADDIGIDKRRQPWADEYRHLAQWVFRKDDGVSQRWTRFLMYYVELIGDANFVRKHEHLSGKGRVRLIEQFHGRADTSDLAGTLLLAGLS